MRPAPAARQTDAVTDRAFVIVSGLPASGKSTPATGLGALLRWPVLDKDAILEALYDSLGVGDHMWRGRLSRAADDVLFTVAAAAPHAVLDNWWHHDTAPDRLRRLDGRPVEVFCACDPEPAARRFQARTRHPGHLDPRHTPEEVAARVAAVRANYPGPLRLGGPLLTVDTSRPVGPAELADLAEQVGALLRT